MDRYERAQSPLNIYKAIIHDVDDQTAIMDLIADLMHLARSKGLSPTYIVQSATHNFQVEDGTPVATTGSSDFTIYRPSSMTTNNEITVF